MYKNKTELADDLGVPESDLCTAKEAARAMGIGVSSVYRQGRTGSLERHKTAEGLFFIVGRPEKITGPPKPAPSPDRPGILVSRLLAMSDKEIEELDKR